MRFVWDFDAPRQVGSILRFCGSTLAGVFLVAHEVWGIINDGLVQVKLFKINFGKYIFRNYRPLVSKTDENDGDMLELRLYNFCKHLSRLMRRKNIKTVNSEHNGLAFENHRPLISKNNESNLSTCCPYIHFLTQSVTGDF